MMMILRWNTTPTSVHVGRRILSVGCRSMVVVPQVTSNRRFFPNNDDCHPTIISVASVSRRWYHELSYLERGDPAERLVYRSKSGFIPEPPPPPTTTTTTTTTTSATTDMDWILVELVTAPCNPADLNVVEGKYPSPHNNADSNNEGQQQQRLLPYATSYLEPEPCRVGGAEGLGRVLDIRRGSSSSSTIFTKNHVPPQETLSIGDAVVLAESGWGSWRSHLWVPSSSVLRVPPEIMAQAEANDKFNMAQVALISQVAGTAYRLLQDFVTIRTGDVVLQNAGTSAVSMCVAELLQWLHPESHLVSFVRRKDDEEEWPELVNLLTRNRTTHHTVFSEDTALAAADDSKQAWKEWKAANIPRGGRVVLGLNSVHGPLTSRLFFSLLSDDAKLITYGAMSKQPLPVPAAPLIFRNVSVCGYWHSRWMITNRASKSFDGKCPRQVMMDDLCRAVLEGGLVLPPVHTVKLSQTSEGVQNMLDRVPIRPLRSKLVWDLSE